MTDATNHEHEHAPSGADAVEPDHQPMKILTVTVVILAIAVIGSGIVLGEWLQQKVDAEVQRKQFSEPPAQITALRAADKQHLESYGFDEETKTHRIPISKAMEYLAANPGKVSPQSTWPELVPLTKPEPKK